MIIETGSQNVSRIPGHYAYPVRRYNTSPVNEIPAVRGRNYQVRKNHSANSTAQMNRPDSGRSASEISQLQLYSPLSEKNSGNINKSFIPGIHVNILV